MLNSSFLRFLPPDLLKKRHFTDGNTDTFEHAPTCQADDSQLESLIERANLDSYVAGRKYSIEYNELTRIVSLTRNEDDPSFVSSSPDEDAEHRLNPEPPGFELEQEPFVEMETENAHVTLFRFLFEPIENAAENGGASELILPDDLIQDLQNLKDRMQHRYNVIKRNLLNFKAND